MTDEELIQKLVRCQYQLEVQSEEAGDTPEAVHHAQRAYLLERAASRLREITRDPGELRPNGVWTWAVAERIARQFHKYYEALAPLYDYTTRPASAVAWEDVPWSNRTLMMETVMRLFELEIIRPGRALND